MPFKTKKKTRTRTAAILAATAAIGSVSTLAAQATLSEPSYTPSATYKLTHHHCPTEDSYMFIPAHKVKHNVRINNNHVYCVQIDNAHRAIKGR